MIGQATIEKLLAVASIVDLIGGTVPLHQEGGEWLGECPACGSRMRVQQSPGYYECSAPQCSERGDAIQWLQRRDPALLFAPAALKLAFFAGLPELISQCQPNPAEDAAELERLRARYQ